MRDSGWRFMLRHARWSSRAWDLNRVNVGERVRWLWCRMRGGHRWQTGPWFWNAEAPQRTSECTEEGFGWFVSLTRRCARCQAFEWRVGLCGQEWAQELDAAERAREAAGL